MKTVYFKVLDRDPIDTRQVIEFWKKPDKKDAIRVIVKGVFGLRKKVEDITGLKYFEMKEVK